MLALSKGGETWVAAAEAGLAAAEGGNDGTNSTAIAGMVDGLSKRLTEKGGTIDEWTRLVRSRLVLGQKDAAQDAYDAARQPSLTPRCAPNWMFWRQIMDW